jgi:hypothetical protein
MTARTPSFPAVSAACQPGVRFWRAEGSAKHGRVVLPLLQDELAKANSAEQRRRLQAIIGSIAQSPVPSEHLRQVRVLALLEQQHSDDARAELKRLAEGHADAALTRAAKAALGRMSK